MTTFRDLRATYQRQSALPMNVDLLFEDLLAYLAALEARVAALEAPRPTPTPARDVCVNCQGLGYVTFSDGRAGSEIVCSYCGGSGQRGGAS